MTGIPVCIFAKPPIAGRVKTRLAEAVGAVQAAKLASAMLCDVWTVVKNVAGAVPVLAATEAGNFGIDVDERTTWLQPPGELGQRIECILQRGLKAATAAIAVGADTPLITAGHLHEAIQHLESRDAVLGPSEDGGFYLLGMHSCPSGLLAGIAWSSEHTLSQTEDRLRAHRMKVARMRNLFDVDTVSELEQLRNELVHLPPEIAPMTRKWLVDVKWSAL